MCLRNIVVNIPPPPLRRGPERQGAGLVQGLSVGGFASVKTLLGTSPKKLSPNPFLVFSANSSKQRSLIRILQK